jgi:hypothetical protein
LSEQVFGKFPRFIPVEGDVERTLIQISRRHGVYN